MLKCIQYPAFVVDVGVMYDALSELSHQSLMLQDHGASILYAYKLMHHSIRVLNSTNDKWPSKEAVDTMIFQKAALTRNEKLTNINKKQFLTILVNNMTARMFTQLSHITSVLKLMHYQVYLLYAIRTVGKQFGLLDYT